MLFRYWSRLTFTLLLVCFLISCKKGTGVAEGAVSNGIRITVTSPTNATTLDTTDTTISLEGTAASKAGIQKITWTNDRGGQGVANGTDSWRIANIALQFGINEVTVIAEDRVGARSSRGISIHRESGEPGAATLFWYAPTSRTDGTPLADLSGYKVLYGRMSGIYDFQINITNPGIVAYVVEDLMPGDWYFAMTAYDSQGFESTRSNEVFRKIL